MPDTTFVKASINGTYRNTVWDDFSPEWSRTLDIGCPVDENEPLVLTMIEVLTHVFLRYIGTNERGAVTLTPLDYTCLQPKVNFDGGSDSVSDGLKLVTSTSRLSMSASERQDDTMSNANDETFTCDVSGWSSADPGVTQYCRQDVGDGEIKFRTVHGLLSTPER